MNCVWRTKDTAPTSLAAICLLQVQIVLFAVKIHDQTNTYSSPNKTTIVRFLGRHCIVTFGLFKRFAIGYDLQFSLVIAIEINSLYQLQNLERPYIQHEVTVQSVLTTQGPTSHILLFISSSASGHFNSSTTPHFFFFNRSKPGPAQRLTLQ